MALLISPHHRKHFSHLLYEMHALRHRVFVGQLKWESLSSPDGVQEIDVFDAGPCHYLLGFSPDGRVVNSMRITGSRDPNVTCDVLAPQMGWEIDRETNYMEMSRMCADPTFQGPDAKIAMLDLVVSLAEVRKKYDYPGGIGIGLQSEIVERIRSGYSMRICAGPFVFPGDAEPSLGIVLENHPNDRFEDAWKLLDPKRHGLMDPDANPEIIERFRKPDAA